MANQFYDLNFEQLDDGRIRLEQYDYSGESAHIDMHPSQLAYIAHQVGGTASPKIVKAFPRGFATRLLRLKNRTYALYELLSSVVCFPPPDNDTEDVVAVRALLDEFDFLIDDFAIVEEPSPKTHAGPASDSNGMLNTNPSANTGSAAQGDSAGQQPALLL